MGYFISAEKIYDKIYFIRGKHVMLDEDLAIIYGVETKYLNRAVKRNIERFPEKFRFQLSSKEYKILRFQIGTTKKEGRGGRQYFPYVFTEQGVSMLSAVLRSETAVNVSIQIMDAFVEMRKFLNNNARLFQQIENIETKLLTYQIKTDKKIDLLFEAISEKSLTPSHGVFFNGQIFDAYKLTSDIIRKAKKTIILIDNYIDETVLFLFTKRRNKVKTTIYTKSISKTLMLDLEKFNSQYEPIEIKKLKHSHDRFLIIDEKTIYHFGASLKDLGKQWFAFSKLKIDPKIIIEKL